MEDSSRIKAVRSPLDRWRAVIGMKDLTHAERIVLMAIALHDGPMGAFPKVERIAILSAMSRASAFSHMAKIESKGRLLRKQKRGPSRYFIAYDEPGNFRKSSRKLS